MTRNTIREGSITEGQETGSQSPGGLPEKNIHNHHKDDRAESHAWNVLPGS